MYTKRNYPEDGREGMDGSQLVRKKHHSESEMLSLASFSYNGDLRDRPPYCTAMAFGESTNYNENKINYLHIDIERDFLCFSNCW